MPVKNRHFRFVILLGIVSIISIALLQYFWFREAFNFQKREFEIKVYSALSEVAREIYVFNGNMQQESFPVEQLSKNYFVVMINDHIELSLLDMLLKRKFQAKSLQSDYIFTIYDCASDNLVFGSELVNPNTEVGQLKLPKWDKDQYYFGVYFPNYKTSLLQGLDKLFALSAVLLLLLIFFAFSLYMMFRQKRLSEIQKDFVNNMTHELKTPLSSIKLSAESLMKKNSWDEDSSKYLEIISHESEKLKRQIENVLEQAKGDREKMQLDKVKVEIVEFLSRIIDQFNFGRQKSIEYKIENPSNEIMCNVDTLHMEHVFHNLLDNVLKYGAEKPKLQIDFRIFKRKVLIRWRDNGKGIPKKYKKRIFSPFFRLQNGNRHEATGFGLGLHYVKNVIKAHKGRIRWVTDGESGYFEILLPVHEA